MKALHNILKPLLRPALAALALPLLACTFAQADTSWLPGVTGNWDNPDNWSDGLPVYGPAYGDPAQLEATGEPAVVGWNLIDSGYVTIDSHVYASALRFSYDYGTAYQNPPAATVYVASTGYLSHYGQLHIGSNGTGAMIIDGGTVKTGHEMIINGKRVFVNDSTYNGPNYAGSCGYLTISGTGLLETGYFANAIGGAGVITMADDGRINVQYGNISLEGGDNSTGYIDLYSKGTVEFELSAARTAGAFITTGSVDTLAGTLNLSLAGDATPGDTLTFILLDATNNLLNVGQFGTVLVDNTAVLNWGDNASGIQQFDDAAGNHYTLDYTADGGTNLELTVAIAAVPEPATWAMLAGGLGVLAVAMRRRGARV